MRLVSDHTQDAELAVQVARFTGEELHLDREWPLCGLVGFEYLGVKQKDGVSDGAGGVKDGKYSGIAGYLGYAIMPKLKASLRAEWFDDKDHGASSGPRSR